MDIEEKLGKYYQPFETDPSRYKLMLRNPCLNQSRYVAVEPNHFKVADHIVWYRNPYYHHAIAVSTPTANADGEYTIQVLQFGMDKHLTCGCIHDIHLAIQTVNLAKETGSFYKVNYFSSDTDVVVLGRVFHLLKYGREKYNLNFTYENFATWCKTGVLEKGEEGSVVKEGLSRFSSVATYLAKRTYFRLIFSFLVAFFDWRYDASIENVDLFNIIVFLLFEYGAVVLSIYSMFSEFQRHTQKESELLLAFRKENDKSSNSPGREVGIVIDETPPNTQFDISFDIRNSTKIKWTLYIIFFPILIINFALNLLKYVRNNCNNQYSTSQVELTAGFGDIPPHEAKRASWRCYRGIIVVLMFSIIDVIGQLFVSEPADTPTTTPCTPTVDTVNLNLLWLTLLTFAAVIFGEIVSSVTRVMITKYCGKRVQCCRDNYSSSGFDNINQANTNNYPSPERNMSDINT